ncbi:MAG: hypothetical protein CMB64_05040 [Euryarchaeota archaeon]|nr:hypothetical protein [Euryarchaeota archaeon]
MSFAANFGIATLLILCGIIGYALYRYSEDDEWPSWINPYGMYTTNKELAEWLDENGLEDLDAAKEALEAASSSEPNPETARDLENFARHIAELSTGGNCGCLFETSKSNNTALSSTDTTAVCVKSQASVDALNGTTGSIATVAAWDAALPDHIAECDATLTGTGTEFRTCAAAQGCKFTLPAGGTTETYINTFGLEGDAYTAGGWITRVP